MSQNIILIQNNHEVSLKDTGDQVFHKCKIIISIGNKYGFSFFFFFLMLKVIYEVL